MVVPRVTDGDGRSDGIWRPRSWNARSIAVARALAHGWQLPARMTTIRVGTTVELPPGKGKVVEVAGRQVTVFNRDGRFYASTTHVRRRGPAFDTSATCAAHGFSFDVHCEDSPASLRDDQPCAVCVDDDDIFLIVE
jgi:nitrite reductase/ring-hydroxylating ferredoxin subunit